jgi:hypothetical protein
MGNDVVTPVEVPVVTERDVLHRAADLLEEFGWCQNTEAMTLAGEPCKAADSNAVSFCIGGAAERACLDLGVDAPYSSVFYEGILGIERYVSWNDKPGRTREEVISHLRATAEASA